MKALVLTAALLLASCAGYDPPMAGDHSAPKYRTDLARCQKQASLAASRKANATPQTAVAAVFQSSDPERQDVSTCMRMRGYTPAAPAS